MNIDKKFVMEASKKAGITVVGAIAGGALGAAFDRFSLVGGIASIVYGVTRKDGSIEQFGLLGAGVGMLVGQGNTESTEEKEESETVEGFAGIISSPMEKAKNFLKGMGKKAFLDKVPYLKEHISLDGLGEAENENIFMGKSFDEASQDADDIIAQIEQGNPPINGMENEEYYMEGADTEMLLNGSDADALLSGTDADFLLNGTGSDADILLSGATTGEEMSILEARY